MPYSSPNSTLEEVEKARLVAAKQRHALEASIGLISLHTHISKTSISLHNSQHNIPRNKIKFISRPVRFLPKRRSARLQRDAPVRERSHKVRGDSDTEVLTEYDDFNRQVRRRRRNRSQSGTAGHHLQNRKRKQYTTERKVDMKSEEEKTRFLDHTSIILSGPPDSSKNLKCDINLLQGEYLGYPFAEFGKDHVMTACSTTVKPKFSKMAAIVEWSNAVFLWVNIDGKEYDNVFQQVDGEMRMTWFGGSRHRIDTPMIQRLLQLREGDAMQKKMCRTAAAPIDVGMNKNVSVDMDTSTAPTNMDGNNNQNNNSLPVMQNHHRSVVIERSRFDSSTHSTRYQNCFASCPGWIPMAANKPIYYHDSIAHANHIIIT
eukprot:311340_1